ncbi:MAG TPA: heavy metal translocating P-type ATPase [Candidatus Butyricicoccus avistercoris]|uniref:Copper-exporting P-type ATPase n=1 Tax=Candidatus Butyricicoccus avistercoris TaxID=2838518 RepID=A0A9D1PKM0_9FIRM|nr:heavy metal translocating P-type ATPase [Candidatus Butyricicoccus avistercoris]
MQSRFNVTGMSCAACSAHVEKAVKQLDGIQNVEVNLLTGSMTADFNENILSDDDIINAVISAGYGASSAQNAKSDKPKTSNDEVKQMKFRISVSFVFLIILMYVSMGHMMGVPLPSFLTGAENAVSFALTQFLLTLPIVIVNKKYYISGFKSLIHKAPAMDTLIAVGSSAALIYSIFALYQIGFGLGHNNINLVKHYMHDLYFESAAMILTLVTLGKYLESRAKKQTTEAISKLMNLRPQTATVIRDDKEITIPIDSVVIGDIVVVRAGQSVPVDGTIISGNAVLDESALTGESLPVDKTINDTVISASISKGGYFTFKATKVGNDTTLSQMIKLVEDASASKAPIAKLADKVSGVFVPVVLLIALATFIIWLMLGKDLSFALSSAITVLVISCPCALGLATPVAIMVGTGVGAKNGVIFRSAEALEHLHSVNAVVLDKTGTITEGKPVVTDIITANNFTQNELLELAYSLEALSEHPLAQAIVNYCKDKNIKITKADNFETLSGKGITANINNIFCVSGNIKLFNELGIQITENTELANQGKTPLYFAKDNKLVGIIAVADAVKINSGFAVDTLEKMGISVTMLTGDNQKTANAIAQSVNIKSVIYEVMPQDKEKHIKSLQESGKTVAMIGDGINDAPALARADVGIAIGAGTDIAIESADIVLMKSDLVDAVNAILLSKNVIRNIKQNLFWAFIYNCIGIPLAAGIFSPALRLTPMFGAAAMSLSSVCVVMNALRLNGFKAIKNNKTIVKEDVKMKKTIKIEGMMCPRCSSHVKDALIKLDGVSNAEVSHETGLAELTLDKDISNDILSKAVTDAGYDVVEIL